MVKFAEILSAYVPEDSANDSFKHLLASVGPNRASAPLDREEALRSMKAGNEWHNNMVRLCASYVYRGLSYGEVLRLLEGVQLPGYTEEETREEIRVAYEGARTKGFHEVNDYQVHDHSETSSLSEDEPFLQWLHQIPDSNPDFLIDGLLEKNSLALVFGRPASGKSFFAVDMAASIATGKDFHGLSVAKGDVVYVAGEGHRGLKRRFIAWATHHGVPIEDIQVMISRTAMNYLEKEAITMFEKELSLAVEAGLKPKLFIIDTVARNYGGGDENSNTDMGRFIKAIDQFNDKFKCATLLVHHSGHSNSQRGRGASSLKGALDTEFMSIKKSDDIGFYCTKAKDWEQPAGMLFHLKTVKIGETDDGEDITNAVLVQKPTRPDEVKITQSMLFHLETFNEAASNFGQEVKLGEVVLESSVEVETWRSVTYQKTPNKTQEAKRKAFERARKDLLKSKFLTVSGNIYTQKAKAQGQTGQGQDIN